MGAQMHVVQDAYAAALEERVAKLEDERDSLRNQVEVLHRSCNRYFGRIAVLRQALRQLVTASRYGPIPRYLRACEVANHALSDHVSQQAGDVVEALCTALNDCLDKMQWWGAQEDGIPEDIYGSYLRGREVIELARQLRIMPTAAQEPKSDAPRAEGTAR